MKLVMSYDDQQRHTILVVGSSNTRQVIEKILKEHNYNVIIAKDGAEALRILDESAIDLLITSMNLPYLGGFGIIEKLQEKKSNIPYIMLTAAELIEYIRLALEYNVGYILNKSFKKNELLNIVYKLLNKERLFGLENYINIEEEDIKNVEIKDSHKTLNASYDIVKMAEEAGMNKDNIGSLRLAVDEMAHNAFYHAHGFFQEKLEGALVHLANGDKVDIACAYDTEKIGVTITDYQGKLSAERAISALKECLENNIKMWKAIETGDDPTPYMKDTGRGLQIALEGSDEFYISIKPNEITQIIILKWIEKNPNSHQGKSLKICEVANT